MFVASPYAQVASEDRPKDRPSYALTMFVASPYAQVVSEDRPKDRPADFLCHPSYAEVSYGGQAQPHVFVIPPTLKLATEDRPRRTFLSSRARTREPELPNLGSIKNATS